MNTFPNGLGRHPLRLRIAHGNLGLVAIHERDPDEAATHFCQSVRIGHEAGVPRVVVEGLYGMAAVAALRDNAEAAVVLRAAADALRARLSAPLSTQERFLIDSFLDPMESGIPVGARSEWRAEGGALAEREAVARAMRAESISPGSAARSARGPGGLTRHERPDPELGVVAGDRADGHRAAEREEQVEGKASRGASVMNHSTSRTWGMSGP